MPERGDMRLRAGPSWRWSYNLGELGARKEEEAQEEASGAAAAQADGRGAAQGREPGRQSTPDGRLSGAAERRGGPQSTPWRHGWRQPMRQVGGRGPGAGGPARQEQSWAAVGAGRRLTGAAECGAGRSLRRIGTAVRHPCVKLEAVGWARERSHGRIGAAG